MGNYRVKYTLAAKASNARIQYANFNNLPKALVFAKILSSLGTVICIQVLEEPSGKFVAIDVEY